MMQYNSVAKTNFQKDSIKKEKRADMKASKEVKRYFALQCNNWDNGWWIHSRWVISIMFESCWVKGAGNINHHLRMSRTEITWGYEKKVRPFLWKKFI